MGTDGHGVDVNLSGQVALVTGGGRGLGRAFTQALAQAGAAVAITARTASQLDETVKLIEGTGGKVCAFTVDVTDRLAMQRVVAETERTLGPIDILVNNAAVLTPLGYDWEVDPDEWWRTLEINVRGPFICTQLVLPGMMARRRGRIVNVSSIAAHTVHPYGTAYCASKAALTHMTNLLAAGIKEYGISIFALSPGGRTAMSETLAFSPDLPEKARDMFRQGWDTGADGTEQSVRTFMFLASGRADAFTGRHISYWNSADELLAKADEIVREDLLTLRLRE